MQPLKPLARWLQGLLWANAGLATVTLLLAVVISGSGETTTRSGDLSSTYGSFAALQSMLVLATGVAWLVWQHRAHSNLHHWGVPGLQFTPGWAVGWWFVPIANLFRPYSVNKELWLASDPNSGPHEWTRGLLTPLLGWWWGLWIAANFIGVAYLTASDAAPNPSGRAAMTLALSDLAAIVAAVLAVSIVAEVTRRQAAKGDNVASAWPGD